MTEMEWLRYLNPWEMLDFIARSEMPGLGRKLLLYAAPVCRRSRAQIRSKGGRRLVRVNERFADGKAGERALFIGGDGGLHSPAVLPSVTASARRHGLEPWSYARDVLTRLPARPLAPVLTPIPSRAVIPSQRPTPPRHAPQKTYSPNAYGLRA